MRPVWVWAIIIWWTRDFFWSARHPWNIETCMLLSIQTVTRPTSMMTRASRIHLCSWATWVHHPGLLVITFVGFPWHATSRGNILIEQSLRFSLIVYVQYKTAQRFCCGSGRNLGCLNPMCVKSRSWNIIDGHTAIDIAIFVSLDYYGIA